MAQQNLSSFDVPYVSFPTSQWFPVDTSESDQFVLVSVFNQLENLVKLCKNSLLTIFQNNDKIKHVKSPFTPLWKTNPDFESIQNYLLKIY